MWFSIFFHCLNRWRKVSLSSILPVFKRKKLFHLLFKIKKSWFLLLREVWYLCYCIFHALKDISRICKFFENTTKGFLFFFLIRLKSETLPWDVIKPILYSRSTPKPNGTSEASEISCSHDSVRNKSKWLNQSLHTVSQSKATLG